MSTFDESWYRDVTEFAQRTHWLNGTMSALTVLLIVILALWVCYAGWRACRRSDHVRMAAAVWSVVGCGVSVGCGLALKQVFHETRPCLTLTNVTTVQACPGPADYSFPSDHTTVAAALAAGLWLIDRRLRVIGAVLAILEGFSRVYLGQHYPHDVLAAYVLSGLIVLGGWRLARGPLLRLGLRISVHFHGSRGGGDGGGTDSARAEVSGPPKDAADNAEARAFA